MPLDLDERLTQARRIIAQRCLYGVDKNPLAVEMAKLSLWLLTLAKDRPFEFLDHTIRCGDSLVGIHDLDQLRHFNLDPSKGRSLFTGPVFNLVHEAVSLRQKIEAMPSNTVEDVQAQEKLLVQAEDKTARLRCAADLLLSVEFQGAGAAHRQSLHDSMAIQAGHYVENGTIEEFRRAVQKAWTVGRGPWTEAGSERSTLHGPRITPFHWPLEFPEAFQGRGGFDAFVCNPPFMGGQKITGTLGDAYREYLVARLANGQRGSADLCSYFFLRATQLLRERGQLGFLATNTIAQGDTREVGLEQIVRGEPGVSTPGFCIPRAVPSRPWPGSASLEVAHVWVRRGAWSGPFVLDDKPTNGITAFLTPPGAITGNPYRLKANESKSFIGSYVLGMGFVLEPEEAQRLIEKDARNKEVLFPYLNGEDLNSRPDQSPSRWVINFFDWPIEKAKEYPDCFRIIEEKVKPERMVLRDTADGKRLKQRWWLHCRERPELYRTIAGMERVLVCVLVSKYNSFELVPSTIVFAHKLCVFALDDITSFALLSSNFHETWVREYSSTLETRLNYSPSDCFETFPFPANRSLTVAALKDIGERYHDHRRQIMLARQEGLTKTYNRFHDRSVERGPWTVDREEFAGDYASDEAIDYLRYLHVRMDGAVAMAYGWPILVDGEVVQPDSTVHAPRSTPHAPLALGHGFHPTKQGLRYTISEAARREVLARLLRLNHERYAEEVRQGLHEKKRPRNTRKTRKKAENGGSHPLFDAQESQEEVN